YSEVCFYHTTLPPLGRPRHDRGIPPQPIGLRLTADLDELERVGVDVEHMVVVLVGVTDRPFLHRAEPHPLVDARGIEDLQQQKPARPRLAAGRRGSAFPRQPTAPEPNPGRSDRRRPPTRWRSRRAFEAWRI